MRPAAPPLLIGLVALLVGSGCTGAGGGLPPPPPAGAVAARTPAPPPGPDPGDQPGFPIRAAFYYPWFPEAWDQAGLLPFTRYRPDRGQYDSSDPAVIAEHVRALGHGHVDAAIVSWWGPQQKSEQLRLPLLFETAGTAGATLRLALYYEKEGASDPPVAELVDDLRYVRSRYAGAANHLRVDGRPVMFVYGGDERDCSMTTRWAQATAVVPFHVVLKVIPGWERCPDQPAGWHQYAPAHGYETWEPPDTRVGGAVTVSPGFWRAGDTRPLLARDLDRWRRDVAAMTRSTARWHLVSTFNEWGEGTAVEGALEWASPSGFGAYSDVLHEFP